MYDVTISSTEGGIVSPQSGSFEEGSSVTITAIPNTEYEFTKWSNGSTQNPLVLTVTSDLTIQATFTKKQYELTISKEGEGTVSEKVINSGKGYDSGTKIELTAVPAGEWVFLGWSGDFTATDNPIQITISSPKNIKAKFVKRKYPLTINIEGQGTVTEEIVNTGRTTDYDSGTTIKLTAQASEEWVFTGWSGDVTSTSNPIQININSAKNIDATFVKRKYPLTINIEGQGTVTEEIINSGRTTDYNSGTTLKLTATPSDNWEFVGWSGAISGTSNPQQLFINEPKTVSALFKRLNPVFLDKNGVTIKAYDSSNVGEKGIINGIEYTIVDEATLRQMVANNEDVTKVVTTKVTNMGGLFQNKTSFNQNIGSWDTSNVTNMNLMFNSASAFNQPIGDWDTSKVNSMRYMFWISGFNQDISKWDVSEVRDMAGLFRSSPFNKDISDWDVSKVISMAQMFMGTTFTGDISAWDTSSLTSLDGTFYDSKFNGDISSWNVSRVRDMNATFMGASEFNQDISGWDTSSVTRMTSMFRSAINFNQPIGNWDTSNVTDMSYMFTSNTRFNQEINSWDVSSVNTMYRMFADGAMFNQPIGNWDVSSVTNMGEMFGNNFAFNQNINDWDVSNVAVMSWMFHNSIFNQPLNNWDVSNVVDMNHMFRENGRFNQDISSWNVSSVLNMSVMFGGASKFNQNIGNWDVSNVTNMGGMFINAKIFNQNLKNWCVGNIDAENQIGWATGSALDSTNFPIWGTCPPKTTDVSVIMYSTSSSCINGNCTVAYGYRISNNARVTINFDRIEVFVNGTNINNYTPDDSMNIIAASQSKTFQISFPNISKGKTLKIIFSWSYEGNIYSTVWTTVY